MESSKGQGLLTMGTLKSHKDPRHERGVLPSETSAPASSLRLSASHQQCLHGASYVPAPARSGCWGFGESHRVLILE